MVELVVEFHQFVAVVGNARRRIVFTSSFYHTAEVCQTLNDFFFLRRDFHTSWQFFAEDDASVLCFAEDRADASVGILDERTRIAVEVDGFFGIEHHVLARIHLEEEVFEGTKTYDARYFLLFSFAHVGVFASFVHGATSLFDHTFYQIVCVYHCTFTTLHFAVGEFDHAIREVHEAFAPFKAETVEEEREDLEVIVLLIAHHIDHLVDGIVAETEFGSTDVLSHVD